MNLKKKTICISLILVVSMLNTKALASSSQKINTYDESQFEDHYIAVPTIIQFKAATFDPLVQKPDIPLKLTNYIDNGYFLVQCNGPILSEWTLELEATGAQILGYIPNYTYIIYINPEEKHSLEELPSVRWIGHYHPAYKIQGGLTDLQGENEFRIIVFRDSKDNLETVRSILRSLGGEITSDGELNSIIRVRIDAEKIPSIAFIPQVEWIDFYTPPKSLMNNIRGFTGATTTHLGGFDGTGIVGEVKDSGIDLSHPDFSGQILGTDGTIVDDPHGTPVFGIVFSSGAFDGNAKGMMPGGQGVFCSWDVLPMDSISNLVNGWGGVFQSNSWSTGDDDSNYTAASREHDEGVFDYDISIFHSAGNSGTDLYTCTQESVAKNVIAVGAVYHLDTQSRSDDRWINMGPGATPAQGPARDGRFKPDLCGPFDMIYSTDSVDGDGEDGYAVGDYTTDFGGTSGATPVVAGAAGLLYQMYKENHFGNNPQGEIPHASTVKAILIADAYQYSFGDANRRQQGWGCVDIGNVYNIGDEHYIENEPNSIQTGEGQKYYITPTHNGPLKISLVWTDVPASAGANPALVNDLDLRVKDPDGNYYYGNYGLDSSRWSTTGNISDHKNNVENVFIQNPQAGTWSIEVLGANVPIEADSSTAPVDQKYSLVASNAVGRLAVSITNPLNQTWVRNLTTISGISKGPVTQVEVKIDSGSWEIATGTLTWDYDWDTELFSEGQHTIYARAFNGTGYSDEEFIILKVDNTHPTTNLVAGSPSYFNGTKWFATLTTPFTLIGNDGDGSGIDTSWYRILYESTQVQPWITGSSFTLSWGAGNYVIQFYSVDNIGNVEDFITLEALVDMSPPQTTLTINEPKHKSPGSSDYNVSILTTFELTPVTDETGISFKWYIIDGLYYEGETFDLTGFNQSWHLIEWGSCDLLGHNETGNSEWVFLDRSPPSVSISEGSPQFREYPFNWLNVTNTTTFEIDSQDTISGVNFTWYSIDGNFFLGSIFTLDGYENGTYTILFGASDNVDNNISSGPYIYSLDLDPPTTLIMLGDPTHRDSEPDLWNVTKETEFELIPKDLFSGIQKTWYNIDGVYYEKPYNEHVRFDLGGVVNDGLHVIMWGSIDNLSQPESENSLSVILDTTGPDTNLSVGEPKYRDREQDSWNVTEETEFTLSSSDTYSGVDTIWYTIDGNYFEGTVFNLSGLLQGYHIITWGASDRLGNTEDVNSQMVFLSKSSPDTELEVKGGIFRESIGDVYNVTHETDFSLSLLDVNQGINFSWYTINGQIFKGAKFDLSDYSQGVYVITWGSLDNLGMNESGNSQIVFLDLEAPITTLEISDPKYLDPTFQVWAVNADTKFLIYSIDNYSGVDYSWYTIDGKLKKGSSFTLNGYSGGSHTISWGSVDNLGYDATGGTRDIILDLLPPDISIVIGEPKITGDDVVTITTSTSISFVFEDTGVNQTTIYYSLDGGKRYEVYTSPFTVNSQTTSIIYGGEDILGNKAEDTEVDVVVDNTDTDSDGILDLVDDDDDNDGLLDIMEDLNQNGKVDFGETDSKNSDTDSDGYNDLEDSFPLDRSKWNGEGDGDGPILIIIIIIVSVMVVIVLFLLMKGKGKGEEVEWESSHPVTPTQHQTTYYPPPPPPSEEVQFESHDEVEFQSHR